MKPRRRIVIVLSGLVIFCCLRVAAAETVVFDVEYGDPPDPRPAIKEKDSKLHYRTLDDLYNPLNEATNKLTRLLEGGDFDAAGEHIVAMRKRFGSRTDGVAWHITAGLYKKEKYDSIVWLAEKSAVSIAHEPTAHPGAFKYYYLSVWRTQGAEAAQKVHENVMRACENTTAVDALQVDARQGWLQAQLSEGTLEFAEIRSRVAQSAIEDKMGLFYRNSEYRLLVGLCMEHKDYDSLRQVTLQGIFAPGEETRAEWLWKGVLLPLWTIDGKGPDHLITLTDEYLADCRDEPAKLRAQYFKATMHHLAAALLYRDIMRSAAAGEVDAVQSDLPFMLKPPVVRELENSFDIVIPDHEPTQNSLSQQAARHLDRLAPGSHIRNWRGAVTDEEANREVREQMLEELLKEDSGR